MNKSDCQLIINSFKIKGKKDKNSTNLLTANKVNKKEEKQILTYLTSVFLFSSAGLLLGLAGFVRPFFSITSKLPSDNPVPMSMTIEQPALGALFSLRRTYSAGQLTTFTNQPTRVVYAPVNSLQNSNRDVHYLSEGSDSPRGSANETNSQTSSSAQLSSSESSEVLDSTNMITVLEVRPDVKLPVSDYNQALQTSNLDFALESSTHSSTQDVRREGSKSLKKSESGNLGRLNLDDDMSPSREDWTLFGKKQPNSSKMENITDHFKEWLVTQTELDVENQKLLKKNKGLKRVNQRALINWAPSDIVDLLKKSLNYSMSPGCDLEGINPVDFINPTKFENNADRIRFYNNMPTQPYHAFSAPQSVLQTAGEPTLEDKKSLEVSETPESSTSLSSSHVKAEDKSTTVLLSEKQKTSLLGAVGPHDEVSINMGKHGLNDQNTVIANYQTKTGLRKKLQNFFKKDWARTPSEYDHCRTRIEHENLGVFSGDNQSYERGAAVSTAPELHLLKGNARADQELHDLSVVELNDSLKIANNVTMADVSLHREVVDINVVRNADQKVFDDHGTTRENTIRATQLVHALDRKQIHESQQMMGLTSGSEYYNFSTSFKANRVGILDVDTLNAIVASRLVSGSPQDIEALKNPAFIATLDNTLYGVWNTKVLSESLRSLYPRGTNIYNCITQTQTEAKFRGGLLLNNLNSAGIDVSALRLYNSNLPILGE